jgi:Uma2 family endonuclease
MLLEYNYKNGLPTAEDLPDSDDTPVDNQLQHLIPVLLETILALIWCDRQDWFFGVDMGIYYDPKKPAIVPDGFLSLGVPRIIDSDLRLSYLLWEEQKIPTLVIEIVSQTRRGEYTEKKDFYQELGVKYYLIYNPLRKRKNSLEIYQLKEGEYELLKGEKIWLADLNLAIGCEVGTYQGITREWLYWYDEKGQRYLTPEEQIEQKWNEGKNKGKLEGKQELILGLVRQKFGKITLRNEQKIRQLTNSQLDELALKLFEFAESDDLNQWLEKQS